MAINIPSQIVVKTAAAWSSDATVYTEKHILVTSDVLYTGTDQRKFKIANGVDTWANLDYMPDVNALIGALTTSVVSEGSNLYFTTVRVLATLLAGFTASTNEQLAATDTVLQALQKLQAQTAKPVAIAASNIDFTAGTHFNKTLSANTTFTFSGDVNSHTIIIKLVQGASAYTVTWPTGVKWSGGTEPVMSTTAGAVDVYTLVKIDGDIMGSYIQNMS